MNSPKQSSLLEKIAAVTAGAIVLSGIVYWIMQIYYANEMLKLAHPG